MYLSKKIANKPALIRMAYRPVQKLIHLSRLRANPDVPVDHRLIKVSYRGRKFSIEVRRWSVSDRMAVEQCFTEQQYDMPTGAHGIYLDTVYREILASGRKPLIVDCGANIGASVLWFSARYPEAAIVGVEPSPANFALLSANCRGVNAELRLAGVGPSDGTAWLEDEGGESGMGCRTNGSGKGILTEIVSLKTLMASKPASEFAPFLLKVDIEGAERSLFTGPASVLNQFPVILMEPHDWMFPGQRTSVEFFRFHAQAGREFAMKHENVASIAYGRRLADGVRASSVAEKDRASLLVWLAQEAGWFTIDFVNKTAFLFPGQGSQYVGMGREVRQRYKFNRRTPYDLYAHSGDELPDVDFGVGI